MALYKHHSIFITPLRETPEAKALRLAAKRTNQEYRSDRAQRKRGAARNDAELANAFRELGFDYMRHREDCFKQVPQKLEGLRPTLFSDDAKQFLGENFDVGLVEDRRSGHLVLHFKSKKEKEGDKMNLIKEVIEKSEVPRKTVKAVYSALVLVVQEQLEAERRVRLPELGNINIKYRAAKPKRKGRNPFNGEMMIFKAKPASNKIRITPAKQLKDFVADNIKVVEPKAKGKKKKSKR